MKDSKKRVIKSLRRSISDRQREHEEAVRSLIDALKSSEAPDPSPDMASKTFQTAVKVNGRRDLTTAPWLESLQDLPN